MSVDFILVRHGETDFNQNHVLQGWLDVPLNAAGCRQAELAAEELRNETFDEVWLSDLKRAAETAEYILRFHPGLPVRFSPELREWKLGILQGKSYEELKRAMPEMTEMLRNEAIDLEIPGGESRSGFQKRIETVFRRIAAGSEGKRLLVVTHGGVLARLYRFIRGSLPAPGIVGNASVSKVRCDLETGTWMILKWGGEETEQAAPPAL